MAHPMRHLAAALVILASPTPWPAAQTPEPPAAAACAPAEPPEPLLVGLRHVAGAFPEGTVERDFLADVAKDIEASHRERAELCEAIERQAAAIAGLKQDVALAERLAASYSESAAGFEKAWREAMAAPEVKRRWWSCVIGPAAGIQFDAEGYAGIGGSCGIAFP